MSSGMQDGTAATQKMDCCSSIDARGTPWPLRIPGHKRLQHEHDKISVQFALNGEDTVLFHVPMHSCGCNLQDAQYAQNLAPPGSSRICNPHLTLDPRHGQARARAALHDPRDLRSWQLAVACQGSCEGVTC
mmetsp:Transcript_61199/g.162662  ORF Transcript_61199/g.162662 Transcript_61199/m.162662 type:complete len:132 (+) Transcript_61199:57-452(+)